MTTPDAQSPLQPGQHIGNYIIEEHLRTGGFGLVYAGRHKRITARKVVIKVLRKSHRAEDRQRFSREAAAAAALDHPNVVTIFDYDTLDSGEPFIAMEYLPGRDLEDELEQTYKLGRERVVRLFPPCLQALAKAHEHGIVHKDLKPSNLFLKNAGTPQESLIILDFGIARLHNDALIEDDPSALASAQSQSRRRRITKTQQIIGTPQYMAPEYLLNPNEAPPSIDVYQMGLIMAESITGVTAVDGDNAPSCYAAHINNRLNIPEEVLHDPQLGPIIERATQRAPEDRYPDARAMYKALSEALGIEVISGSTQRVARVTPRPTLREAERSTGELELDSARMTPATRGALADTLVTPEPHLHVPALAPSAQPPPLDQAQTFDPDDLGGDTLIEMPAQKAPARAETPDPDDLVGDTLLEMPAQRHPEPKPPARKAPSAPKPKSTVRELPESPPAQRRRPTVHAHSPPAVSIPTTLDDDNIVIPTSFTSSLGFFAGGVVLVLAVLALIFSAVLAPKQEGTAAAARSKPSAARSPAPQEPEPTDEAPPATPAEPPSASAATPSPTKPPPRDALNPWVSITPPSKRVLLGVPSDTPAPVRGFRPSRARLAPSEPYAIQTHEVTWGELEPWVERQSAITLAPPVDAPSDADTRAKLPATGVPWDIARAYCQHLGGDLPTEVQWEFAARGATLRRYAWGSAPLDPKRTRTRPPLAPVMTSLQDRTPLDAGHAPLYDMTGNALEWTLDLAWTDAPQGGEEESWYDDGLGNARTTFYSVRGFPIDTPNQADNHSGAAYRSQACARGACASGDAYLKRLDLTGFRCVKDR